MTRAGAACQLLPFQNWSFSSGPPTAMQKSADAHDSRPILPSGSCPNTVLATAPVQVHRLPFQLAADAPLVARQKVALGQETRDNTSFRPRGTTSRTADPVTDSARAWVASFLSRYVPVARQLEPGAQAAPDRK